MNSKIKQVSQMTPENAPQLAQNRNYQKPRVLVVEDETDVRNLILLHLGREGYEAIGVEDSEKALILLNDKQNAFDLFVLDWMLPGLSGLDLCKKIAGSKPVLMVTARADTSDIVLGLEMGADDYITKPFQISVFNARVRALLRRAKQSAQPKSEALFEYDGLSINFETHVVSYQNERCELTPFEFKALQALTKNRGVILSRTRLISLVQGEGLTVTDRSIDTMIFGLRKNLNGAAKFIETVRGVGYRFTAENL